MSKANIEEYIEAIRQKSGDMRANNNEAVLNTVLEFEEQFDVPLEQFTRPQMVELFKSWETTKDNTFQQKRLIISGYMRWLVVMKGISCDPSLPSSIAYFEVSKEARTRVFFESTTQIAAAFRKIVFTMVNGVPQHLREGLAAMLKTVGLELDEISVLERDDIDFEKRIIHGATKDYEEVEPCILALIQEGMANAFFFDGRFYQDLMWSDLVIQPVRRRPMELTEASVRNMLLRMSKYGKNSDFKDKSFAPTDLMTSYVFSKLYEYECISGERVLNKIGRDPVEPYWGEIDRWSGMRLKSFKARKSFIKEYIEWKEFYNKRV